MFTFLIGLTILLVGGFIYAQILQKVFKTNKNIKTIAFAKRDNVDYVPMNKYKNAFIQLKSVAATGPILGPIQGIIFGPIVFLTIPIGNIFGGLVHDTYSGLISMRNGGAQVPKLVQKIFGKVIYLILFILIVVLSLLVGAVFITMPAKLVIGQIQHAPTDVNHLINNWVL
jgi:carbon starvation protein CstA